MSNSDTIVSNGGGAGTDAARQPGLLQPGRVQRFLQMLFERLNAGRKQRLAEELSVMKEMPERRMESCKRERVKVDSGSLIYADRNAYSVPSRLIGEQVEARLYMDHVEVWYGQKKVEQIARLRGRRSIVWTTAHH